MATTHLLGFPNTAAPLPSQWVSDGQHSRGLNREQKHWVRRRNKATCREDFKNKSGADVIKRRKTYFKVLLSVWAAARKVLMFGMNIMQPGIKEANLHSLKEPLSGHTQSLEVTFKGKTKSQQNSALPCDHLQMAGSPPDYLERSSGCESSPPPGTTAESEDLPHAPRCRTDCGGASH